jgi:hypothetical protein
MAAAGAATGDAASAGVTGAVANQLTTSAAAMIDERTREPTL